MRALRLDATGDLDVTNKTLGLVSGRDAIKQKLLIGLRTFVGEWFLDVRTGVPYYTQILVKNPQSPAVAKIFKKLILSCDGVTAVTEVAVSFDNKTRELSVTYAATTDDGSEIPINDSFVVGNQA